MYKFLYCVLKKFSELYTVSFICITTMSENSDKRVNCVFCGQEIHEKLIKFPPEILQKCMVILEYGRTKPVRRKSRSTETEISEKTSLNDAVL